MDNLVFMDDTLKQAEANHEAAAHNFRCAQRAYSKSRSKKNKLALALADSALSNAIAEYEAAVESEEKRAAIANLAEIDAAHAEAIEINEAINSRQLKLFQF